MKRIRLTQGYFAQVSDEDYDDVCRYKWHAKTNKYTAYAARREKGTGPQRKCIYLHRYLLKVKPGEMVDHKDGNGLNNTRENIRIATNSQNGMNRRLKSPGKSSRYKGVSWGKMQGSWLAHIMKNNKTRHLGSFSTQEDAARAYNKAAIELFGEFACLNVVESDESFDWQAYFRVDNI